MGRGSCGDCEWWARPLGVSVRSNEPGWCGHPAIGRPTTAVQGCAAFKKRAGSTQSLDSYDMNKALESLARVHAGKDPTRGSIAGPAFVPLDELRRKAARLGRKVA